MKSYVIIDGSHLIYRSVFKGLNLYTSSGIPSGGSFILLKMLWNIKELGTPIMVMDGGHSKFRTELFEGYKQKEAKVVDPNDVASQQLDQAFNSTFSILTKLLPNMGIPVVKIDGEEADDIAYLLTKHLRENGDKVYLLSGDEDWIQNVKLGATVCKPKKDGDIEYFTPENFNEKYGFDIKFFALWKSIVGDSSDRIPGIKGIGPVGATKIIKELISPALPDLKYWADNGKTKLHEKVNSGFSIAKRNTLLIDFDNIQIPIENVIDVYNSAENTAKVDFNYVKDKFKSLEMHSLTNWLVYLGQKV